MKTPDGAMEIAVRCDRLYIKLLREGLPDLAEELFEIANDVAANLDRRIVQTQTLRARAILEELLEGNPFLPLTFLDELRKRERDNKKGGEAA